ncbi:MAG: oligosaccharide flippase family protein [Crocinitomicaceae bacterium]|nr:oligosaccharide flippase family protein [Crocinitomicaceae bacterium]
MLRDLLKEGGHYTLASLATKGISLLLIPFYSDYFTTAEYGILALLAASGALTAAVFSFQIYQGVGRFISDKSLSEKEQKQIGSSGFFFTTLSYGVFILIALIFKTEVIDYLSEEDRIKESTYYFWLIAIFLNGFYYNLGIQLRFLRKTKIFGATSFLFAIANVILILFFALVMDYRIDSIFIANLIVAPIIILIQLYHLRDYMVLYMGRKEIKKLLRFSTPLIPASVAYIVLNFTDRIFIKDFNNALGEVGIYDMAFKFSALVSIIILAFQSALAPIIYEKHNEKNTLKELGRIFRVFLSLGTMGILLLSMFSYETLYIFTQPQYFEASILMPIFYLTILVTGLGMFSPGLHVKQRTKTIPFIVITSALLNIALNYWIIPIYHLWGAALATLISTLFNNLVLFYFSQRVYPIHLEAKKTIGVIILFLVAFVFVSYMSAFIEVNYLISILIRLTLLGLYTLFLIRIKFISFAKVQELLKIKIPR